MPWGPAGPTPPSRPCSPSGPCEPAAPTSPLTPCGPSDPALPSGPCRPVAPWAPWAPCGPFGPSLLCAPVSLRGSALLRGSIAQITLVREALGTAFFGAEVRLCSRLALWRLAMVLVCRTCRLRVVCEPVLCVLVCGSVLGAWLVLAARGAVASCSTGAWGRGATAWVGSGGARGRCAYCARGALGAPCVRPAGGFCELFDPVWFVEIDISRGHLEAPLPAPILHPPPGLRPWRARRRAWPESNDGRLPSTCSPRAFEMSRSRTASE